MKKKSNPKLTVKQRSFINHYLANGGNGTQAAKDAGYKGNDNTLGQTANENLKKPKIAKVIKIEQKQLKEETGATAKAKREMLWKAAKMCMQVEEVMDKDGPTGELRFDSSGVVRCIAELNKMDGDLAVQKIKTEVSVVDHVRILEMARERSKS